MENTYVYKQQKKLRCGYTTGTCAAAASMAAAAMLLGKITVNQVAVDTPRGTQLVLPVEGTVKGKNWVLCQVEKDAGDDPDVTHGIGIQGRVCMEQIESQSGCYTYKSGDITLHLLGGVGIGNVTKPGLDCEVGKSAINSVPRKMIFGHVERVCRQYGYCGDLWIQISAPEGQERAKRTFNSQLGIRDGISILGTTGIVEPMSEEALLETIRLEIRQKAMEGRKVLLLTPGNYGEDFIRDSLGLDLGQAVKCSNYVGQSIDMAVQEGFQALLLVGHGGKLVKTAAGIMNTHSSVADGRMEILAAYGAACGAGPGMVERILDSITVDQALDIMDEMPGLVRQVTDRVMERMKAHLQRRAGENMKTEAVMFTNSRGLLGRTEGADELLVRIAGG